MSSSNSYQAVIAKIERLQRVASILREREKKPVLAAIAEAIHHYEITLPELRAALGSAGAGGLRGKGVAGRQHTSKGSDHPLAGRKIPAKYKHPKTGQTWSGRGSTPVWLQELESKGIKRDSLLVAKRKA